MRSFKKRLLSLIVMLVVIAQGVTIALAYVTLRKSVTAQSSEQLQMARSQIDQRFAALHSSLQVAADLLVNDHAFREVVVNDDRRTINSALRNSMKRADADIALLYSDDGTLKAATANVTDSQVPRPPQGDGSGASPGFAVINGRPYQLVFADVNVPQPYGWAALGLELDQALTDSLRKLVNTEVSIVSTSGANSHVVSTLPVEAIRAMLGVDFGARFAQPASAQVAGESYLTVGAALTAGDGRIELLLQRSLDQALAPLRQMWGTLLLICCTIICAAVAVGVVAGNSALRPLAMLVDMARQIAGGNYRRHTQFDGDEEFRVVASSFDAMQAAIEQREARIVEQATRDGLTGFLNRQAFRQRIDERIASQQGDEALTVAMLDILRFRDFNASMGHQAGNELLREVGRRVQALTHSATDCARIGADQYAMVLAQSDLQVLQRLSRLIDDLRAGIAVDQAQVSLDLRIGIAQWRYRVSADDLLRQAGVALVEAKSRSDGPVLFQPSHEAELNRRVTLVTELRRAIAGDQLTLAYQPLVSLSTREAVMFEALVRWTHPTLGEISPGEFVPLAERAGVIGELSRWVMSAAIRQMGVWQRHGLEISVAVNLSAADMSDATLPMRALSLLQEHHVPPPQLLLEVTESTIMQDAALAAQLMQQLRVAGLRFAVDDFGTGYSTLASLHNLPVDELKIDRAFVTHLDRNTANQAIIRAVTELAHSMGLKVVAEGIETPEVWAALARLGCDIAQGYFVSRPMRADAVPGWLGAHRSQLSQSLKAAEESGAVAPFRPRVAERGGA
jgi:diguanylate cyclase (GGDEF)-like protein